MNRRENTEDIFVENYLSARIVADHLCQSVNKLGKIFPLSAARIEDLDEDALEAMDAFIKRFTQLQDAMENRVFRGVAFLEQEDIADRSKRDIAILMEKFGIVPSAEEWSASSILRNKLTHEYPLDQARCAERLNEAFQSAGYLIDVLARVRDYVHRKGLAAMPD